MSSRRRPGADPQLDDAERVMLCLPGDAPDDVTDRCRRLVAEVGDAPTISRRNVLLAALRQEVQRAIDRSELVTRNRAEVERLYRRLGGLGPDGKDGAPDGHNPGSPRGYSRTVALDAPLPVDLSVRVGAACDERHDQRSSFFTKGPDIPSQRPREREHER